MAEWKSTPKRRFGAFGTGCNDPTFIPDGTKACYEALFPIEEERDPYDNMIKYLRRAYKNTPDADWAEILCTMQNEAGTCVAIGFLSFHRPSKWWFGNYFGIEKHSRKNRGLVDFFGHMIKHCGSVGKDAHGIVFETEPFQEEHLERTLQKFEANVPRPIELTPKEVLDVRAALRAGIYTHPRTGSYLPGQAGGAYLLMTEDIRSRQPLSYVQPAMELPLDESNEVPLWLMIYPFEGMARKMAKSNNRLAAREVKALIDALYLEWYADAYASGDEEMPVLPEYDDYLAGVYRRVKRNLAGRRFFLKAKVLSDDVTRLISRHRQKLDDMGYGL